MSSHSRLLVRALEHVPFCHQLPLWTVSAGLACAVPCAAALSKKFALHLATVRLFLAHSPTFFLTTDLCIYSRPQLSVAELAEVVKQLPQLHRLQVLDLVDGSDDQLLDVVLSSRFLEEIRFTRSDPSTGAVSSGYRSAHFEVGVMTRHHNEKMRLEAIWRLQRGVTTQELSPADAIVAGAIEHLIQAVLPAIRAPRSDRDGDGGQLPLIARHSDQFGLWRYVLNCLVSILHQHSAQRGVLSDENVNQLEPLLTNTAVFNVECGKVLAGMAHLLAIAPRFPELLNLLCGDDGSGGVDQHGVLAVAARDFLPKLSRSAGMDAVVSGTLRMILSCGCESRTRRAEICKHVVEDWNVLPSLHFSTGDASSILQSSVLLVGQLMGHRFDDVADHVVSFEQGKILSQMCDLMTAPGACVPFSNLGYTLMMVIDAPAKRPRALTIMSSCGLAEKLLRCLVEPAAQSDSVSADSVKTQDARVILLERILSVELEELGARLRYQFPELRPTTEHRSTINSVLGSLSAAERDWFAAQEQLVGWTNLLGTAVEKPTVFDQLLKLDWQQTSRRGLALWRLSDAMSRFAQMIETHLRTTRLLEYPAAVKKSGSA